ncbi:putative secreted protein [Cryptosporidium canis]|uniref:Secreted protein n=1 Tax=Cryptosporidium canis TaxID=195482 RepID=A0ABQ8P753_9CRYT|nr:putative secreted protein [Cryptosporidium canis]
MLMQSPKRMNKFILLICILHILNQLANCFISSLSGPFILIYSILRTIDGMTENIQHISNSLDLSLQSFLSNQIFGKSTDNAYIPLAIGADYHGSASPCELLFYPTLSFANFTYNYLDGENSFQDIKSPRSTHLINLEATPLLKNGVDSEKILCRNFVNGRHKNSIDGEGDILNNSENFKTVIEPINYNTKMISTDCNDIIVNNRINDYILTTKILNPIQGNEIYYGNTNDQNIRIGLERSIPGNEIYKSNPYDIQSYENNKFDLDSFKLYTYYTAHYLFQITGIFSMGISMHSQYRQKSRQRKLHLVK